MRFRPHAPADHGAIAELRWQLKSDDSGVIPGCDKDAYVESYRQHLAASDACGDTVHWLAEDDGEVVAAMTVRTVRKEPSPRSGASSIGYLTNCYVRPAHRGRGIGTRLLGHVREWAEENCLELLIVWPSDRSYSLYRRAGFAGEDDPLQLVLCEDDQGGAT